MLPRKCKFCERRFVKAEHLKRHQRSHTGEKPYKCTECAKRFSRSDVRSRHMKAHTQHDAANTNANAIIEEEDEGILSTSEQEQDSGEVQEQWISQDQQDQQDQHEDTIEVVIERPVIPSDSMRVHPSHHQDIRSSYPDVSSLHQACLGDLQENFTQESNQQPNWTRQEIEMAGLLSQNTRSHPGEHMSCINPANDMEQWHCEQARPSISVHHSAGAGGNNAGGESNPSETQSLFRPWLAAGDGGFSIPDEFQFWFNHIEGNPLTGPQNPLFNSEAIIIPDMATYKSPSRMNAMQMHTTTGSLDLEDCALPNEGFMRVEHCWPHRSAGRRRMMHTLWRDVCNNNADNLFSEPVSFSEQMSSKSNGYSRRGLDDEVRDRLEKIFSRPHTTRDHHNGSVYSGGGRSETSGQEQSIPRALSDSSKFPPAEILDMGLDFYLRHFQPLYPFIHLPTFHPKTTNTTLLHVMCLIGLTLINSRGATNFVNQQFNAIFEVVEAELSSYSLYAKVCASKVLSTVASGISVVALAEILGSRIDQSRTQRLYVQIIQQCHEQRLFAAADSEPLNNTTFESFQDNDLRWKAWSRVESAKRWQTSSLITTMLFVDTWAAGTQNTCPIIRTDNLQFLLPCDAALFQCKSSSKWVELLSQGHQMCMPAAALSARHATIPRIVRLMDTLSMQGILALVRLRIYENYHRLLSGSGEDATETSLVPWQTFATDSQAQITPALVVEVMDAYGDMLGQMNPNCIALWHNTCIMLTADVRIFELGAGCAGPAEARQALGNIAIWTQTRAARRAILHAAQTFKIMSNRRASDGDPFHLSNGLFHSALVLALYIFMVPQRKELEDDPSSFELLDDVDWRRIGHEGLAFGTDYVDDPAVRFINGGGSISLDGVVHHGGYQSARRILVDFVQLLDEVGKWRAGRYTQILRIMSDALVDDESLEFHA